MFGITETGNAGACVANMNGLERAFVSKEQQHPLNRHETNIVLCNTSKPTKHQNRTSGT